jgi:hypothetical protein
MKAFETLGKFLNDDGWSPEVFEDIFAYRTRFEGKQGTFFCLAQVYIDLEQFAFYAIPHFKVPMKYRKAVSEYITRANYGLRLGNFELDLTDGELRFKNGLDFEGEKLSPQLIRNVIYPAVQTLDLYLPGFESIMKNGKKPIEALEAVEAGDEKE